MPRPIRFPADGSIDSLFDFGRSLEDLQQEIGPLATAIYGAQAREAISVSRIPKTHLPHAGVFLHVTIRAISNGDPVRSYAFSATGGSACRDNAPAQRVSDWDSLAQMICDDIDRVCSAPFRAMLRLYELGSVIRPKKPKRSVRRRHTTHIYAVS